MSFAHALADIRTFERVRALPPVEEDPGTEPMPPTTTIGDRQSTNIQSQRASREQHAVLSSV